MAIRLIAIIITLATIAGAVTFFEPAAFRRAQAWLERRWRTYTGVT